VAEYGEGLSYSIGGSFDASDHTPFEWAGFQACLLIEAWGNPPEDGRHTGDARRGTVTL
jgi:hypothetical protein